MPFKLLKFRVECFRSIQDSNWIDCLDNTCLIGTNEAGKTNLLVALWKLNPANDEPILPLSDYPRKEYVEFKGNKKEKEKTVFIRAVFSLTDDVSEKIAEEWGVEKNEIDVVEVSRDYKGEYTCIFPNLNTEIDEEDSDSLDVEQLILDNLPRFVYYSDYGNLDSEIYLPNIINLLNRLEKDNNDEDMGLTNRAKARTLKVLFDFVKLSPKEILDLGTEAPDKLIITHTVHAQNPNNVIKKEEQKIAPTDESIRNEKERKKEREVLLQSASAKLTSDFKYWWKQGNYRFRFQADGRHFRIWVSDEKRTEEIELEGRSRGLQWFFSFFLVFLVESRDSHNNCILLLDEPGISLHPIAQKDLIYFFNSLSEQNQLIYTTHSPFLVNADNLAFVKAVYVDDKGFSSVSDDLRKNSVVSKNSIYPINAAIGINVSDSLLIGCQPVLVEGNSDLFYLNSIKNFLLKKGLYTNDRELVFIPTGGVRGIAPIASIVASKSDDLPFVIIDSDQQGKDKYKKLEGDLYKGSKEKLISIETFMPNTTEHWELEDLIPSAILATIFARLYKPTEYNEDFDSNYIEGKPMLPQMEAFAKNNGHVLLPESGWKVEIAKRFQTYLQNPKNAEKIEDKVIDIWKSLFNTITS